MKYVFEWYIDPKLGASEGNIARSHLAEFDNDVEAIQYAKDNGADYVWDAPVNRNPDSIFTKPYGENVVTPQAVKI